MPLCDSPVCLEFSTCYPRIHSIVASLCVHPQRLKTRRIQLLYPFICQWTFRLFPCPGYCKQSCNELHWGTCVFFELWFPQGTCPVVGLLGHMEFYSWFLKESRYHSPQWLHQFTFPPTVQEDSLFSTSSPAFIVCRFFFFDDGHYDQCEMTPHFSFDLHFSNNEYWSGVPLPSPNNEQC